VACVIPVGKEMYSVKEIFYTLQGEGINAGKPAVFCRFVGCNLWSGQEKHRDDAVCKFCDTDFLGGFKVPTAFELAEKIHEAWWRPSSDNLLVVLTGGEPGLQVDEKLISKLHGYGFSIAIETNGTVDLPDGIDWICVSPKANTELRVTKGDELKLVYPQESVDPSQYLALDFKHFLLQPMDGDRIEENTRDAIEYCKSNTQWRLSTQTHKTIGIR
jgi:7-carboxy-7-deazaguanine synthase